MPHARATCRKQRVTLLGWTTKQRKKTEQPNCCLHRHVQPLICTSVSLFTVPAACARLGPRSVRSGSLGPICGSLCLSVPPLPLAQRGRSSPGRAVVPLGAPTPCCERTIHTHKRTRGCTRARASPGRHWAGWSLEFQESGLCDS